MFKLLRKYNKFLLAIFGVLLMITFLIPQAIDQFSRQSGMSRATVATVADGQSVSGDQWFRVQQELSFLQKVSPMFAMMNVRMRVMEAMPTMKPEHWFLLTREADQAGLVSTGNAVGLSEQSLIQLGNVGGTGDLNFIKNTMAKVNGVEQLIALYQTSGLYSDRRLKSNAERLLHQVVAQLVVIEASDASEIEPDEQSISAQFEAYKDALPGTGDKGFGYKLPDRVKLEWLHVSYDSAKRAVEKSDDFNGVAQRLHWRKYEKDAVKGFPPIEGNAPVPDVVRIDLLNELTAKKLEDISKYAVSQLRLNRRGIPEKDGYVVLPDDWAQHKLAFTALAAEIQSKFGVDLPAYESTGDRWFPIADLAQLPEIGKASTEGLGAEPMSFSTLVSQSKELAPDKLTAAFIQQDVAGPPLRGSDSSLFLFRIIGTDPTHTAKSVDEVREAVIADLKRMAVYEQLVQSVPALEQEARTKGLLAMAMDHGTQVQRTTTISVANRFMLMQMAQNGMDITAMPTDIPVIGRRRDVVENIIDRVLAMPRSTSFDALPEDQRTFALAVPERLAVLILRLTAQNPLTQEEYVNLVQLGAIQGLLASEDTHQVDPFEDAFSADAIAKRNNFKFTREATEPDEPPLPATAAAVP